MFDRKLQKHCGWQRCPPWQRKLFSKRLFGAQNTDYASANPLLDSLHLDNLSLRRKKIKAKIMFKILKGHAPAYLQNLFSARGTGYDLRNSEIKLQNREQII